MFLAVDAISVTIMSEHMSRIGALGYPCAGEGNGVVGNNLAHWVPEDPHPEISASLFPHSLALIPTSICITRYFKW